MACIYTFEATNSLELLLPNGNPRAFIRPQKPLTFAALDGGLFAAHVVAHVHTGRGFRPGIEGEDFDSPNMQLQEVAQALNLCRQYLLPDLIGLAALFSWRGPYRLFPPDNVSDNRGGAGRPAHSHLSFAFPSATVCHCILDGASAPPRFNATM